MAREGLKPLPAPLAPGEPMKAFFLILLAVASVLPGPASAYAREAESPSVCVRTLPCLYATCRVSANWTSEAVCRPYAHPDPVAAAGASASWDEGCGGAARGPKVAAYNPNASGSTAVACADPMDGCSATGWGPNVSVVDRRAPCADLPRTMDAPDACVAGQPCLDARCETLHDDGAACRLRLGQDDLAGAGTTMNLAGSCYREYVFRMVAVPPCPRPDSFAATPQACLPGHPCLQARCDEMPDAGAACRLRQGDAETAAAGAYLLHEARCDKDSAGPRLHALAPDDQQVLCIGFA